MQNFMIALVETSIAMSVIALVYMALTPFLSKKFTAKGRYYAWLVIIIGLILPFRLHPQVSVIDRNTFMPVLKNTSNYSIESYTTPMLSHISWDALVAGLWLAGVIVFITIHIIQHIRFLKMVKRWSTPINERQVLNKLSDVQAALQIKQQVDVRVCPNIPSPMLLGFIRPTILLPPDNIPTDELSFIFKHELVHFKRKDVWYKTLTFIATALHWFNPLVYMIARQIAIECEISCDEEVVKKTDLNCRQKYVETIIGVIRKQAKAQSKFSTNFYAGKQGMKHRVFSIMNIRNKKWGISIIATIVVATLSTGVVLNVSASTAEPTTVSEVEMDMNGMNSTLDVQKEERVHPPLLEEAKTVLDKESLNTLPSPTEPVLLIEQDENTYQSESNQLIEVE